MLVKRVLTVDECGPTNGAELSELCRRDVVDAEGSFDACISQRWFGSCQNNADAATCSSLPNCGLLIFFSLLYLMIYLS